MKRTETSGDAVKGAKAAVCYVLKQSVVYVTVCAVAYNPAQGTARSFASLLHFKKIDVFLDCQLIPHFQPGGQDRARPPRT
jgi:hypothetical protein